MKRNPRKKVPEKKFCAHIHADDHHTRPGERCRSIKLKNSKFCYFHQPNQEVVMRQLAEARDMRKGPPNEKHGFYSKTQRECNKCALNESCDYYEAGKKVCDFTVKKKINLSTLEGIKDFTQELVETEMARYRKLEPFFAADYENMELFDLSSKIAKRITSILKDYSAIKATYEKRKGAGSWNEILA